MREFMWIVALLFGLVLLLPRGVQAQEVRGYGLAPLDVRLMPPATQPSALKPFAESQSDQGAQSLRTERVWTGAAVGAGVSTVAWLGYFGAVYYTGNSRDGMGIEFFATPVVALLGAGVGALVGAAWPEKAAPQ